MVFNRFPVYGFVYLCSLGLCVLFALNYYLSVHALCLLFYWPLLFFFFKVNFLFSLGVILLTIFPSGGGEYFPRQQFENAFGDWAP